jgi:hypothetical protein
MQKVRWHLSVYSLVLSAMCLIHCASEDLHSHMFLTRDSSSDKDSTEQFTPNIMTAAIRQHTAALRAGREGGRLAPELLRLENAQGRVDNLRQGENVDIQGDRPFVHTAKSEGGHSSSLKKSRIAAGKVRIDQDSPLQNQLSPRQREEKREQAVWTGASLRDIYSDGVNSLSDTEQGGLPVSGGIAGVAFGQVHAYTAGNQPRVSMLDSRGEIRRETCPLTGNAPSCYPVIHNVTALIYNNPGCSPLVGTSAISTVNGVAIFTDLMIENEAREYRLQFLAGIEGGNPVRMTSGAFRILYGRINLGKIDGTKAKIPPQRAGVSLPDVKVVLEYFAVASQSWKQAESTYQGTVLVDSPLPMCEMRDKTSICSPPVLSGTTSAVLVSGQATFTDLRIHRAQSEPLQPFGAMLRFLVNGMASTCGTRLVPSFEVAPDTAYAVLMTQVYW